jgi:hypothetical protein
MDSTNKVVLQIIFCYVEATHRELNSRFNTSTVLFPATEYNAQDGGTGSNGSDFFCLLSPIATTTLIAINILCPTMMCDEVFNCTVLIMFMVVLWES